MKLQFSGKNNKGKEISGVRESADRFSLARDLRGEGIIVTSVTIYDGKEKQNVFKKDIFSHIPLKDKIVFASNLSTMISAGLSLSRALSVMERQTSRKSFKVIIGNIKERVSKGLSLADALKSEGKTFPPIFIAMVSSGEQSGNLPESLKTISNQLKKSYDLRRKVRGAMIYPAVIIFAIVVIAILMMIFLIPTLTQTFTELGVELPLSTRVLIGMSDTIVNHPILIFGGATLFVFIFSFLVRTARGRRVWAFTVLHLPIIGKLVKKYNAAVTMRTMSSLILSGVSMIETIEITEGVVQNPYYKEILSRAKDQVQKGILLSKIFSEEEKLYPIFVGEMTEVGEETGNLADMMAKGADFFEEDVDQATKNLSTIIEPVLMIVIGIAVGIFAISMIGPLYSLSEAI